MNVVQKTAVNRLTERTTLDTFFVAATHIFVIHSGEMRLKNLKALPVRYACCLDNGYLLLLWCHPLVLEQVWYSMLPPATKSLPIKQPSHISAHY